MREAAVLIATAVLFASTRLTWAGVFAVAVLAVLLWDAQRRIRRVLKQMDANNERLDEVVTAVEDLKAIVIGTPPTEPT